jgi:ribosomal protein L11 methyltransferase
MLNYIHLKFATTSKEQQEILIALLSDQGFEGFEEGNNYLSAFIPENQWHQQATDAIRIGEEPLSYTTEVIAPRNWNEEWEKNFEPVIVHDFCAVRAHFHQPVKEVQYEVIITPKMSFGTGHHATTFMMIEFMQQLDLRNKTVLDFGTGTGILAILAEKQGASAVTAIDNDDWSINNAAENIGVNKATKIVLEKAHDLQKFTLFNVILANINKHVLLANMAALKQHLTPGGVLIMSGLLSGDRQDIEHTAGEANLKIVEQKQQNNWIALQLIGE